MVCKNTFAKLKIPKNKETEAHKVGKKPSSKHTPCLRFVKQIHLAQRLATQHQRERKGRGLART